MYVCVCAVTYAQTYVLNKFRVRKVNLTEQLIMAYGGLRGAMAFALCTLLDRQRLLQRGACREMLVTCTLFIIIFTTFLQVCQLHLSRAVIIHKSLLKAALISVCCSEGSAHEAAREAPEDPPRGEEAAQHSGRDLRARERHPLKIHSAALIRL